MSGKNFALHEAARDGKILTVKGLISSDPKSVLVKDDDGRIPLHWAVTFQHLEIISILLNPFKFQQGETKVKRFEIDIDDFTDDSGWTALHIASSVGNLEILQFLLNHEPNPDVNLQTNTGLTSIHLATSKNHLDIVKELVSKGGSVRIKDKKSQYPIHRAAANGYLGLVELFSKDLKSPLNAKDINGWTPLHHALSEGFGDVAISLVKFGADYNIQDNDGLIPIQVAVDENVAKYFKAELLSEGLDV
ncbi:hypothetical protein WICMUC_005799 [Wickerhamomyces mucosus]|uniref:Uncharacterized protein n=1 Tax=Wickerhamomyces mucosus TaxID=1378264 RepID=A0A9P8T3Q0_9ASCO|nr:hypothetical protein WICMUC_005799 [Wickerhamomyces mucosus]